MRKPATSQHPSRSHPVLWRALSTASILPSRCAGLMVRSAHAASLSNTASSRLARSGSVRAAGNNTVSKFGTIFEDSPIKLDKWLCAIWMIVNAKNGESVPMRSLRALGVTQKTAWFMMHRIRLAFAEEVELIASSWAMWKLMKPTSVAKLATCTRTNK